MHKGSARNARVCRLGVICAVLTFALPLVAHADSIIGDPVDWDDNPASGLGSWTRLGSEPSTSIAENTDTASDHFLQITFDSGIDPAPGAHWYETVKGPSDDLFALTWETDYWIEFDFWAKDTPPDTLQIRWGDDTSGRIWGNTVTSSGLGWSSLRTDSFSNHLDWRLNPAHTASDFTDDLASIDWIGVYIFRDGTDEEIYGVDDMKLMVPEPEEYLMLAAALITALLVMRRRQQATVPVKIA